MMYLSKYAKPISLEAKSDIGVLVIHGYTSTTSSIRYFAEKLHKAGFNVEAPSLTGHGTVWQDLNRTKYKAWLDDVDKALKKLKKRSSKIFVSGLSMGGALSLYLAEKYRDISGIIVVNHPLFINREWRIPFIFLLRYFVSYRKAVGGDVKDPSVGEMSYDKNPLKAICEFIKLIKRVKRGLPKIDQPILIFKSVEDHVIPIKNVHYTFDHIASEIKEVVWLKNSYHVATVDHDKDIICKKSIDFIKEISKGRK